MKNLPASATQSASANQAASASSAVSAATLSASAAPPASASFRPPAPAEGRPPASASNPQAWTNPRSSTSPEGLLRDAPTPRILILRSTEKPLASLSPFHRRDGCDRFGKVVRCERLRDGGIEVEFEKCEDAARVIIANSFTYSVRDSSGRRDVSLPLTVEIHRTKNFSRGVIFCLDLDGVSDAEIEEGLADFGVTAARRIRVRRGGELVPTNSVILTFDRTELPREVKIGYEAVKVRPYVPAPMRCFRCLRFGHTRDSCRNRPACGKCAATDHTSDECSAETFKCVNCDGTQTPHSAFDRRCPSYLREKEILSLKVTERLSFREARDRYNAAHPRRSYASVVAASRPSHPADQAPNGNIHQLIALLQSFGLRFVASNSESSTNVPTTPQQATPACSSTATQTSPPGEVVNPDQGDWTLVRGRRGAGPSLSVPSTSGNVARQPRNASPNEAREAASSPASSPSSTAVLEAIRRGEAERKAREAKRARLAEKAREAKRSPSADETSATSKRTSVGSESTTSQVKSPRPMGPPPAPPPPPSISQRRLLSPSPAQTSGPPFPAGAPPVAPLPKELPSVPNRPAKRSMASSPSREGGTPRSRAKLASSGTARASSADGRLLGARPRIHFGDSSGSETGEVI